MEYAKGKQIEVNADILAQLITRVDEIERLIETLEVNMDKTLLKQIEQSRKDFASGKGTTIRSKKELKEYLASLG